MIVVSVVASGALVATLTFVAARRWPEPVESPHVAATTIVAAAEGSPRLTRIMRQRTNPAEITGLASPSWSWRLLRASPASVGCSP